MLRSALVLLAAVSACASPAPSDSPAEASTEAPPATTPRAPQAGSQTSGQPGAFDAAAWLVRARAALPTVKAIAPDAGRDDPNLAAARALTDELDGAVGWQRTCDSRWSPDRHTVEVDDNGPAFHRGDYSVLDVGAGEAVVSVLCDFGAHSGSYAYVHVSGHDAALLAGQSVGGDGAPFGPPSALYYAEPTRVATGIEVYEPSSVGTCGTVETYRIASLGTADLVEARGQACGGAGSERASWPVVFPR